MARKKGRYEVPQYVHDIKSIISEKFPDTCPSEFQIDQVVKTFWDLVEENLIEGSETSVYGFGKFRLESRYPKQKHLSDKLQYYPKFKWSRHAIIRIRNAKGTNTPAELKEIDRKKEFMRQVWKKRNEHQLNTKGYLSPAILAQQETYDPELYERLTTAAAS